jgi:hypothetical protein
LAEISARAGGVIEMADPSDFDMVFDDLARQYGGVEALSPVSLALLRRYAMALSDVDSPAPLLTQLAEMLPRRPKPSAEGESGIDRLYRECREWWNKQPGPHGPAATPAHVEACTHPACKEEVLRALEIAEWACKASELREQHEEIARRVRAEVAEAVRPPGAPGNTNAATEATPASLGPSYAQSNVTELPRSATAGLVLITEMKADFMGGPVRPRERWVSREEHDKIERLRRLGEVPPQPPGPPPTPREQYEREMMDAAHRDAAGDGLYGNFVASYERGDP